MFWIHCIYLWCVWYPLWEDPNTFFQQNELTLPTATMPSNPDNHCVWCVFMGIVLAFSSLLRRSPSALDFPPLCRDVALESPPRSFNCSLGSMIARSREYGSPRWRPRIIMRQIMTLLKVLNLPQSEVITVGWPRERPTQPL